jgi:hypothetical protein
VVVPIEVQSGNDVQQRLVHMTIWQKVHCDSLSIDSAVTGIA